MTTTEWVIEEVDEHGDIECEYWPTEAKARAYAANLNGPWRIARVTNHWDRRDRENLLDREYEYVEVGP
jgi:hypothetical protein